MASVYRYRCMTCNTDLGSDGATVESHLVSNPTHSIEELLFDSTKTVANIEGATRVYNNELYVYDESRSLWLSVNRSLVGFGIPTTAQNNVYMRLWGGMTPTTAAMGWETPANATITALIATRTAGTGTGIMSLRAYGGADLTSITLSANVLSGQSLAINVNIAAGQNLCAYLTGSATSSYPQLVAEVALRI